MRRALLMSVGLLLLSGCARYYWTKSGATAAEFDKDNIACTRAALGLEASAPVNAQSLKSTEINETAFRLCLTERGYRREKYAAPPENAWRGFTDEN